MDFDVCVCVRACACVCERARARVCVFIDKSRTELRQYNPSIDYCVQSCRRVLTGQ